jgi:murein DD-endopeptidase MepM/ murein hydrolase activator NlpD
MVVVALALTGASRAAEAPGAGSRTERDVAMLGAREATLAEQAAGARASARWRARALYRLVLAARALPVVTRARAINAAVRALERELGEARTLAAERELVRAERAATTADGAPEVGAPPALGLPVAGPVLARFGPAVDRETGLLLTRAGVRLGASALQAVRAPGAGFVVRVAAEPEGLTVVLDHGGGWTSLVGGLSRVTVSVGDSLVGGQRLGAPASAAGAVGFVTFEVWRGRRPVDPLLLLGGGRSPLAASGNLP